jgi:hypothetical protein
MFWIFWTYTPVKDRSQAQNRNDCSVKCRAGVRVNFWTFGLFVYTRTKTQNSFKNVIVPGREEQGNLNKLVSRTGASFTVSRDTKLSSSFEESSNFWTKYRDRQKISQVIIEDQTEIVYLTQDTDIFLRWEALSLSLTCAESSLSTNVQRTLRKRSYRSRITPHFCNALSTSYYNLTSDMGFFPSFSSNSWNMC